MQTLGILPVVDPGRAFGTNAPPFLFIIIITEIDL